MLPMLVSTQLIHAGLFEWYGFSGMQVSTRQAYASMIVEISKLSSNHDFIEANIYLGVLMI
jgi:hypothetical protein